MPDVKRPRPLDEEPAGTVGALGLIIGLIVIMVGTKLGIDPLVLGTIAATAGPPATAAAIRGRVFSPATVARMHTLAAEGKEPESTADSANGRDPGWLRAWWPLWLVVLGVGFVGPEAVALVSEGEGGTLSEMTRPWLGLDPDGSGMTVGWVGLTVVLLGFAVWFPLHLRKLWPWERPRE